jgi:hypothetical protein
MPATEFYIPLETAPGTRSVRPCALYNVYVVCPLLYEVEGRPAKVCMDAFVVFRLKKRSPPPISSHIQPFVFSQDFILNIIRISKSFLLPSSPCFYHPSFVRIHFSIHIFFLYFPRSSFNLLTLISLLSVLCETP